MPDERSRLKVLQTLSEKLDPDVAAALMECVPPFAWTEIATKSDLAQLEKSLEATTTLRFDALEAKMDGRFEGLEGRLSALIERKASTQNPALLLAVAAAAVVSLIASILR